jgi:hypothetical protein
MINNEIIYSTKDSTNAENIIEKPSKYTISVESQLLRLYPPSSVINEEKKEMLRNLLESKIPEEMVAEQLDPDVQFRKEESILGEELNPSYVTERGLVGDREYALIDQKTGKVISDLSL